MARSVYELAISGVQTKYSNNFKRFASEAMNIEDAFVESYDEVDGQNRTEIFKYFRDNYNNFQQEYVAEGFELGKGFYDLQRATQEKKLKTTFPAYSAASLTKALLDDNVKPYWEIVGLLKKVNDGDFEFDTVAEIGAKGIADLVRASTQEQAKVDYKTVKVQKINLSSGACKFCREIASYQEEKWSGAGYAGANREINLHANCNCTISYEFANISIESYNRLSRSQQRRLSKALLEQNS